MTRTMLIYNSESPLSLFQSLQYLSRVSYWQALKLEDANCAKSVVAHKWFRTDIAMHILLQHR